MLLDLDVVGRALLLLLHCGRLWLEAIKQALHACGLPKCQHASISSLFHRPPPPHPACPQDVKDKFMRLQADFDNFRKRTAAEKDSMRSAVRGDTVAELLPLVSE